MNQAEQQRYHELMEWQASKSAAEAAEMAKKFELHLLIRKAAGADARSILPMFTLVVLICLWVALMIPPSSTRSFAYTWTLFGVAAFFYFVNGMMALEMTF